MAELKGTQVAAIVVPFTDADKYATHDAEYGKGGFRSVETIAKRDAIPTERKTKGMVVRVNETGLHYYWNGSAWTEWLPKGSMLVDAMFDIHSTNPVQNKVITTRINEHAAKFDDIYSKIENIPTITIDTALSTTSTNPVQNKVITNNLNALAGIVNGIPIITVDTVWNATSNNPASSRAIDSTISPIRTTANAAIPKSKIDTSIDGTETAHDAVPSVGAVVTYVKSLGVGGVIDWNSGSNLSQNGYQKFSNGLMIQWGYVGGSATASYIVTMPMSFYNTTYNVFATVNKPRSDNSIYSASPLATSKTVSAFYINRNYASGGSTGLSQESWQWFAVGRWK